MRQLFYWKTFSWRENTWKQNTASCTKQVTGDRAPLASAATNNYVTKITPYIISRYNNMTDEAVPKPRLLVQNQSSHQWQIIVRCQHTQQIFVGSIVLLASLMTSTSREPRSRQTRPQHDNGGSGSSAISCCAKCVRSETTLNHTFSILRCWLDWSVSPGMGRWHRAGFSE
jgi:hypothetical protein